MSSNAKDHSTLDAKGRITFTHFEIRAVGLSPSGKTKQFEVTAKDGPALGRISWFGRWRCYVFQPAFPTVYEQVCLREIASFIEAQTKEHRAA